MHYGWSVSIRDCPNGSSTRSGDPRSGGAESAPLQCRANIRPREPTSQILKSRVIAQPLVLASSGWCTRGRYPVREVTRDCRGAWGCVWHLAVRRTRVRCEPRDGFAAGQSVLVQRLLVAGRVHTTHVRAGGDCLDGRTSLERFAKHGQTRPTRRISLRIRQACGALCGLELSACLSPETDRATEHASPTASQLGQRHATAGAHAHGDAPDRSRPLHDLSDGGGAGVSEPCSPRASRCGVAPIRSRRVERVASGGHPLSNAASFNP
jgi:hypothetical protein